MQKGSKAVSPTRGRSPNQPSANFVQKGVGARYANTRTPVSLKFNTKKKHD